MMAAQHQVCPLSPSLPTPTRTSPPDELWWRMIMTNPACSNSYDHSGPWVWTLKDDNNNNDNPRKRAKRKLNNDEGTSKARWAQTQWGDGEQWQGDHNDSERMETEMETDKTMMTMRMGRTTIRTTTRAKRMGTMRTSSMSWWPCDPMAGSARQWWGGPHGHNPPPHHSQPLPTHAATATMV